MSDLNQSYCYLQRDLTIVHSMTNLQTTLTTFKEVVKLNYSGLRWLSIISKLKCYIFLFFNPITYLDAIMHKNVIGLKMGIAIYTEVGI